MSENSKNFVAYVALVATAVLVMWLISFVSGRLVPAEDTTTTTTTTTTTATTTTTSTAPNPQVQIAPNGPGTGSCAMKLPDDSIIECPPLSEGG